MQKDRLLDSELLESLMRTIALLPGASVQRSSVALQATPHYSPDEIVKVSLNGHRIELIVEARRELFPRDVHQHIWRLREHPTGLIGLDEKVPMLIANAISRGSRDVLQTANVGYFDAGGSLFIPSQSAYILIDRPPPRKAERAFGSIFVGQRARIVQAVVEAAPDWVSVKGLAARTGVSQGTASGTLTEMENRDWLDIEGAGPTKMRRLKERGRVLDEWARTITHQKPPKIERYYVPGGDAAHIARRIDDACSEARVPYAVTAEAAAQAYAPYLTAISQLKCRMQDGQVQKDILSRLEARPVSEGWNLGIFVEPGAGDVSIGERIDGIAYAPIVQVYLDLLQGAGRAKEMADHLRSERLADQ